MPARILRIEVHFEDKEGTKRMIRAIPEEVEAIFLQKSKIENFAQFEVNGTQSIGLASDDALKGDKNAAASTALSDVCYLIGGSLFCWMPE